MSKKKEFKVYVIGPQKGYGRWIQGNLVSDMEEADVVVLTGGEDISPVLYGEKITSKTRIWLDDGINNDGLSTRDRFEVAEYKRALKLGIPVWGTCRGAQLLCAMAGGKLIQDMSHYGSHTLHMYDGEYEFVSNSLHHQMQYPYNMPDENYKILAWTHGLSRYHHDGEVKQMEMPEKLSNGVIKEPEFVYYPKIKGLGIQGHPEMMDSSSKMVETCHAFLNLLVEDKLNDVLLLNIPVKDIVARAWKFKFTKEEKAVLDVLKNAEATVAQN